MKIYVGHKKHPVKEDKVLRAVTIYDNNGKLLENITDVDNYNNTAKFSEVLDTFAWAINKIKSYVGYNRAELKDKNATIFIDSKTLYNWFERETAPDAYLLQFSDIVFGVSLIRLDSIEISYIDKVKVNYDTSNEIDGGSGIDAFFKEFEEKNN